MSVSTAEPATTSAPAGSTRRRESLTQGLTGGRFYLILCAVALLVGAVSLVIPSTPSYDPWSWLLWGREIVHLDLQTTGGPSWKPLPMIPIAIFSIFGKAAPDLWLVVARAGAFMAAVMVFKVAATLTRLIVSRPLVADAAAPLRARLPDLAPAVLAGAVASITLVLTGGFLSDNALGYSEGLMTACVLIAVERHLDGHRRQAFAVGFAAALDRPEIWLFWGPYGLWLFWRDPGARKLVIGLFALIPVFWFLPEYWGSGHFFRGVSRAQQPRSNSSAFANCPFCSELKDHAWNWVLLRIKFAALVGAIAAGVVLWRARAGRAWRLDTAREHALAALLGAALLGVGWFVLIAIMTQAGFSGNDRYLVLGAALVDIAGAATLGWAARELAGVAGRLRGGVRRAGLAAGAGVAIMALWYLFVPNWVGANLINIPRTHGADVYQARLRTDAARAVKRLGGAKRVLACGTVMTEGFQVPLIAWTLGTKTLRVEAAPLAGTPPPPAPNVVFQARATRGAHLLPLLSTWSSTHYRLVDRERALKVYASCAPGATL